MALARDFSGKAYIGSLCQCLVTKPKDCINMHHDGGGSLTGHDVDVDVYTFFFNTKMDVEGWNAACILRIADDVGGVDAVGYGWNSIEAGKCVAEFISLTTNGRLYFQLRVFENATSTINATKSKSNRLQNQKGFGIGRRVVLTNALTAHKYDELTCCRGYPTQTMPFGFGLQYTMLLSYEIHHYRSSISRRPYSIMYQLKPEPIGMLEQVDSVDDALSTFLKRQFTSLYNSALMIQRDSAVFATLGASLAISTLNAVSGDRAWRNYISRLHFESQLEERVGWPFVRTEALEVSLKYGRFQAIVRYLRFQESQRVGTDGSAM